ncbi:MAG: hypothetical protein LBB53_02405 [Prevotellaceae bacterium]|jgi:hypothetical protein|nr:hypothetical protein [Prevotellaceae bacterium]
MKNFMIAAFAAAFALTACDKKNEVLENNDKPAMQKISAVKSDIRVFNSIDELSDEIDKTLAMNFDELVAYEKSIGFNSFGKLSDMAYQKVAEKEDDYKSVAEVKSVIKQNYVKYLQLIEDSTGISCETNLYLSPLKYIVNDNKIYQVNDTLVKVLSNATIFTLVDNYEDLLIINEENIESYTGKSAFSIVFNSFPWPFIPVKINHLGKWRDFVDVKRINGRDHKLYVVLHVEPISSNQETMYYKFASRRKGIWNGVYWTWSRDIQYDITVTTGYSTGNTVIDDDAINFKWYNAGIVYNKHDYESRMTCINSNYLTIGTNTYLVRTRGYASYSPNLYVDLRLN